MPKDVDVARGQMGSVYFFDVAVLMALEFGLTAICFVPGLTCARRCDALGGMSVGSHDDQARWMAR